MSKLQTPPPRAAIVAGAVLILSASWSHGAELKHRNLTNSIGMKLVEIPAGEFLMGSAESNPHARRDESPRHRVRVSRPFFMGAFEVTQREFARVTGADKSFFSPRGKGRKIVEGLDTSRFPAEEITWLDAARFCRELSALPVEKRRGRVYRLPTEAEWEYACRAGSLWEFHFGDSLSAGQANFNGRHPLGEAAKKGRFLARTVRVGSYQPNAWGLYDMHGNVWEWCGDWYDAKYYANSPAADPRGPVMGSSRVIRGGGWYSDARDCRSAFRYAETPRGVFYVMGFRVVMTVHGEGATVEKPTKRVREVAVKTRESEPTKTSNAGEEWPRWRGPRGDGTWRGPKLAEDLSQVRRLWRASIGGGYSGLAAVDGRVFAMDFQRDPEERDEPIVQRDGVERVLCFDADSGKKLWTYSYNVEYLDISYGTGPRATPAVHDGRVYTLGAVGHLHCLEAQSGKLLWSKDLAAEENARVPMWGLSPSPVVFGDVVIVHAGAQPGGCLLAFDRRTGRERWRALNDEAGYATPVVARHRGRPLLICWTPSHVRGVDPRDGQPLWSVPYKVTYGTAIAMPIFQDGIAFVSGYWEGARAIRLGEKPSDAKLIWSDNRNLRGLMSQPLYRNGHAYLLDKRHGLTCFELSTGKKLWDDDNRLTPKGRNPQVTLIWTGEEHQILALNSDGELVLAKLSPHGYQEQSRKKIISATWAHPAYYHNRIYARSDEELVAVELPLHP